MTWDRVGPLPDKFCSQCGRTLVEVWVQKGYDAIEGGPRYARHLRCPKKVTSAFQYFLQMGDWHDELIDPMNTEPLEPGDPGPIVMAVKWR